MPAANNKELLFDIVGEMIQMLGTTDKVMVKPFLSMAFQKVSETECKVVIDLARERIAQFDAGEKKPGIVINKKKPGLFD